MTVIDFLSEHVFPAWKLLGPVVTGVIVQRIQKRGGLKSKSREEKKLTFLSEFLAFDVNQRNPIILEQAFRVGLKQKLRVIDITSLLKFPSPLYAFSLYKSVMKYVRFEYPSGKLVFTKAKYESRKYRSFISWTTAFGFLGAWLFGWVALYVGSTEYAKSSNLTDLFTLIVTSFGMFASSILLVDVSTSVDLIDRFLEEYEQANR